MSTRLPYLRRDQLDAAGAGLWDSILDSRGAGVVRDDGGLAGPFNAWIHAPGVGSRLAALGAALRFETGIDRRLLELAILTVGAHWKAEFEWWAHSRMAAEAGLAEGVIEAIRTGLAPPFQHEDERVVHQVAVELVRTGTLEEGTYADAQGQLGDPALVELVSLCGYYTLVSYSLNAFGVPLPEGAKPAFGA